MILYKRERCHLCDVALEVLQAERHRTPFFLAVKDISGDPDLEAAYGEEIPVVFIDGRKRFFGKVDPVMLRRALRRGGD